MKQSTYMHKEWRTDNRKVPMLECLIDKKIQDQAKLMRKLQGKSA